MIIAHMDPFYVECRAYGCIENNELNGKIAVRCHGFTSVSALQEDYLSHNFDVSEWNRPFKEYKQPAFKREPFRAIFKALVSSEISFDQCAIKSMLRDLMSMRKLGLFVRDIKEQNYREDKLIDFSVSWTVPHIMLSNLLRDDKDIELELQWELELFDLMIKYFGI